MRVRHERIIIIIIFPRTNGLTDTHTRESHIGTYIGNGDGSDTHI